MEVQTLYVLVSRWSLANARGQTRRKSIQWRLRGIVWRHCVDALRGDLDLRGSSATLVTRKNIAYLFTNDSHKYFELDYGAGMPHSGIASRTSTAAVIAKHSFVARSVAALQIS
jgi:hypothetical protein